LVHDTVQVEEDFTVILRVGCPFNEKLATVGTTVDGPPCDLMVIGIDEELLDDKG
jgi:hypothetical protein